jgi:ornithine cyclodeaminase
MVVEWREQSLREAGDLVLADPSLLAARPVLDLGEVLDGRHRLRRGADDIVVLKSVGVGLEDLAIAGLAYRRLTGEPARPGA